MTFRRRTSCHGGRTRLIPTVGGVGSSQERTSPWGQASLPRRRVLFVYPRLPRVRVRRPRGRHAGNRRPLGREAEAARPGQEAAHRRRACSSSRRVVLALVTGLSTLYLYRHYNGNLDVDRRRRADRRPAGEEEGRGPQGAAQHPGDGLRRPRRPGQQHRQPDRRRQAVRHHDPAAPLGGPEARVRHQHPARLARRPARVLDAGRRPDPRRHRRDVERGLLRRRPGLHGAARSSSSPASRSTTSSSSTSRASAGWSTRSAASRSASPSRASRTRPTASTSRPAPASSRGTRPSTTCASATCSATAPTSAG